MAWTSHSPTWSAQNRRLWPEMITLSALMWIGSKIPLARMKSISSTVSGSSTANGL